MTHEQDLRRGYRWSLVSIVWTAIGVSAAIAVGAATGALSLISFGLVGALDGVGSLALARHLRYALSQGAVSPRRDRVVLYVVAAGMTAISLATGVPAGFRLAYGVGPTVRAFEWIVAAPSVAVLAVAGAAKVRVGKRIPSRALVADGYVSATGASLAAVAVIGAALSAAGLWWIDAAATLVIAFSALAVATASLRT